MMKTELIRIYDPAEDAEGVLRAGDILAHGGLVAIPTETVYGLAPMPMMKRPSRRCTPPRAAPAITL